MAARMRLAAILGMFLLAATAVPVWAAAPTNDDIGSPTVVGVLPYTNVQDTTEATTNSTDPECFESGQTVWYEFTPADAGWYQLDTLGSDYDTTLAVGVADGTGGIEVLGCNDDSFGVQSRLTLELEAGATYLAVVGSYAGSPGGMLVFNVDATSEPVALDLTVTIDPVGHFLRDGTARISGTVACNVPAFGYLQIEVSQRVGRFTVLAYAETGFDCSPEGSTWELDARGITGKFAGGNATVRLYADAFAPDKDTSDSESLQQTVRLTK